MTRIILDVLRQAEEPLTTRDIAFQLMQERALDTGDVRFLRLMTKHCGVARRGQRDMRIVRSEHGPGQYGVGDGSGRFAPRLKRWFLSRG